jgi:hypothetical protein
MKTTKIISEPKFQVTFTLEEAQHMKALVARVSGPHSPARDTFETLYHQLEREGIELARGIMTQDSSIEMWVPK